MKPGKYTFFSGIISPIGIIGRFEAGPTLQWPHSHPSNARKDYRDFALIVRWEPKIYGFPFLNHVRGCLLNFGSTKGLFSDFPPVGKLYNAP